MSRSRAAIGQPPTLCEVRTTPRKNAASSSVVKLMPSSTTGPWKCPDSTMSRATVAPWRTPPPLAPVFFSEFSARRDRAGMDTSVVTGAPAMPGSVVATKRTPESTGSAITRLNERAALAPPGRSRTDRCASAGPAIKSSQASLMATSPSAALRPSTLGREDPTWKVGVLRKSSRTAHVSESVDRIAAYLLAHGHQVCVTRLRHWACLEQSSPGRGRLLSAALSRYNAKIGRRPTRWRAARSPGLDSLLHGRIASGDAVQPPASARRLWV